MCVQAYVKMYQGDELPEPKSMLQANRFLIFSNDVCSGLTDAQSIVTRCSAIAERLRCRVRY